MYQRFVADEIEGSLNLFPVSLITGARQSGKTTLAKSIAAKKGYHYITFDDSFTLVNAQNDPSGWLEAQKKPLIIDEVQRVPEIFLPIKKDVDENRIAGRYLLTGSANPLLLPKLGDSLAGRMGITHIYPFAQSELRGKKAHFLETIFSNTLSAHRFEHLPFETLCDIMIKGGFPSIQSLASEKDRNRWMSAYLQTIMQKDVRDLANIEGIKDFPRLFRLLATRTGTLLNGAEISRSLGMVNATLHRYLRLLETLFFIHFLPAWYTNLGKRIVKSPKLHLCDMGIVAQLLEINRNRLLNHPTLKGQFLESFVFTELQKLMSWSEIQFELYHFRDGNYEVDFVLERADGTIIGIEIKNGQTIHSDDIRGLKHLQKLSPQFKRGVILHAGNEVQPVEKEIWAMPIQSLWAPF